MLIILKLPYPQLKVSLIDAYCNSICMLILLAACRRRRVLFFVLFYSAVFRRWYTSIDYCSSSMRCHCSFFCNDISGKNIFIWYLWMWWDYWAVGAIMIYLPQRDLPQSHQWRGILGPSISGRPARTSIVYLFWFLLTLLLTISIFTLLLLFTYSRLLQFLHTRIPTLLELTLKSICLIKNKSLNFPESRRNKKMLEPTRRLMMVS